MFAPGRLEVSFDVAKGSFDVVGSLLMSVRPLTRPVWAVCHTAPPWLMAALQEGKHTKWPPVLVSLVFHAAVLVTRQWVVLCLRSSVFVGKSPITAKTPSSPFSSFHVLAW